MDTVLGATFRDGFPSWKEEKKKKTWHYSLEGKFRILGLKSLGDFFHAKYAFFQENLKGVSVLSV